MAVQILKEVLTKQVQDGMKIPELAEYYGLPHTQMKKAIKAAGLRIRSFPKTQKFVLVDTPNSEQPQEIPEYTVEDHYEQVVDTYINPVQEEIVEEPEVVEEIKVGAKSTKPIQALEEEELDMELINLIGSEEENKSEETKEENTPQGDDDFIF